MNKILLILALGLLVFVAGCTSGNDSNQNRVGTLDGFRGGDQALTFEFGAQAPPTTVRDQGLQPFSVRLSVTNNGEFDIPEGEAYVTLTGFNPQDLGLNSTSRELMDLRGFRKQGSNVIPGASQQITFDNLRYVNSIVSGSVPMTLFANVCYPYETRALALVCINGNTVPSLDGRTTICNLEGRKDFANSGGPVRIENVQQYPFGRSSIQIQFDIVHKPTSDQANLYERGSIDSQCRIDGNSPGSSEALFKRDRVTYLVETGLPGLSCEGTSTGTNTVTLTQNKYTVTCIQDTTNQQEYVRPISILLKYDYLDRKGTQIRIDHIDTN